jgi:hypothetical protein
MLLDALFALRPVCAPTFGSFPENYVVLASGAFQLSVPGPLVGKIAFELTQLRTVNEMTRYLCMYKVAVLWTVDSWPLVTGLLWCPHLELYSRGKWFSQGGRYQKLPGSRGCDEIFKCQKTMTFVDGVLGGWTSFAPWYISGKVYKPSGTWEFERRGAFGFISWTSKCTFVPRRLKPTAPHWWKKPMAVASWTGYGIIVNDHSKPNGFTFGQLGWCITQGGVLRVVLDKLVSGRKVSAIVANGKLGIYSDSELVQHGPAGDAWTIETAHQRLKSAMVLPGHRVSYVDHGPSLLVNPFESKDSMDMINTWLAFARLQVPRMTVGNSCWMPSRNGHELKIRRNGGRTSCYLGSFTMRRPESRWFSASDLVKRRVTTF